MVNYALLYGKSAFTLAKDIGVSSEEAQEFIDAYFAGFPNVRAFIDGTLEAGRATGMVKTMFGRRRLVPELTSRNFQVRSAAERMAVNMPIQGVGSRHPEEGDDRRPCAGGRSPPESYSYSKLPSFRRLRPKIVLARGAIDERADVGEAGRQPR